MVTGAVSRGNPRCSFGHVMLGGATVYSENRDTGGFKTSMTHKSLGL